MEKERWKKKKKGKRKRNTNIVPMELKKEREKKPHTASYRPNTIDKRPTSGFEVLSDSCTRRLHLQPEYLPRELELPYLREALGSTRLMRWKAGRINIVNRNIVIVNRNIVQE